MLDTEIQTSSERRDSGPSSDMGKTRGEREEVRRLRERLGEAEDLSAETAERLVEALADERIRAGSQRREGEQREGVFWMGAPGGVVRVDPKGGQSALADARKQLEERSERREKVAEPLLTAGTTKGV